MRRKYNPIKPACGAKICKETEKGTSVKRTKESSINRIWAFVAAGCILFVAVLCVFGIRFLNASEKEEAQAAAEAVAEQESQVPCAPRKTRRKQVAGRVSSGHLAGGPAAWVPGPERLPHPREVQSEGGRKEAMQDRISPPQACNLLGSSHLISRLIYKMTCVVSHR